eukprot:12137272-Karenia_brevis.AAC.1
MGANAVASEKQGRCRISAITVAKSIRWDPWVMGPVDIILHMIQIPNGWDGEVGREWIRLLWDLRHAPHPWARVKGPMGPIQMHLIEIGWEMQ